MDHSVDPDPRVMQDSPEVEEQSSSGTDEHRPTNALLDIPAINVITGSPPLSICDTAAIVEQNIRTDDTTPSDNDNDDELTSDGYAISLADVSSVNTQNDTVRRQGSERKSRSPHAGSGSRRRTKSSDRPSSSDNSVTRRMPKSSSSVRLSRKSYDFSSTSTSQSSKQTARPKSPEQRNISVNQSSVVDNSSDSEEERTVSSSAVAHKKSDHDSRSVASSNSSLTSLSEERHAADQPPCTVGEKIMVETPNGFKFGKVKFIGPTEFAAGEWIGIALERPTGELL